MTCEEFQQNLEQDSLPAPASAHLSECADCRDLHADFKAIHTLALELGAEEIAPPDRVWIALRGQLETEGLIVAAATVSKPNSSWWAIFQKPAFAGGFLGVILSAAILTGMNQNLSPVRGNAFLLQPRQIETDSTATHTVKDELLTAMNETVSGLAQEDPALTASLRRNLDIVDNLIAVCEKSVRDEPENDVARDYLNGAYEQKAELLATAMNHGSLGGLR